jgi:hypothetical protein
MVVGHYVKNMPPEIDNVSVGYKKISICYKESFLKTLDSTRMASVLFSPDDVDEEDYNRQEDYNKEIPVEDILDFDPDNFYPGHEYEYSYGTVNVRKVYTLHENVQVPTVILYFKSQT